MCYCIIGIQNHSLKKSKYFDEFWSAYPRTRDLDATQKAFKDAVELGAAAAAILSGAKQYCAAQQGNKPHYIAYAENWLKRKGWTKFPAPINENGDSDKFQEIVLMYAERIKSGQYVHAATVSAKIARSMVSQELVTQEELQSLRIEL